MKKTYFLVLVFILNTEVYGYTLPNLEFYISVGAPGTNFTIEGAKPTSSAGTYVHYSIPPNTTINAKFNFQDKRNCFCKMKIVTVQGKNAGHVTFSANGPACTIHTESYYWGVGSESMSTIPLAPLFCNSSTTNSSETE